ncbi:FtsJ-like methyltransferase-domain-containing protein [Pelagophyceae sp. CCMP2097]|nr:FtsJ-like methyltransferase-domain-containing protein [Pelagophyceae sp. CCMP2097]
MVKKAKKVDRTDKWYVLAKEQGYRSRAAFKLAQINKEYAFLNAKTKVVLDLCAAPGGWAQIAAKCVPQDAAIIAVDLLPIKPIPRVRCIVGDITTQQTRDVVKREVKNAGHQNVGVDVVLCDGAPNVGTQYTKDAFVQNEISLLALRCGIDCGLRRGGTFCTKVYRSQDYNALLWAFGRLFEKVKAFKPAASRVQSAEIFVVCEGYLKPDKVDAKLLDPKHVFSDVDGPNSAPAGGPALVYAGDRPLSVLHPQWGKKQRHRVGYDERNTGILELGKISARDFVDCKEPAQMLAERSQIVFEGGGLANHPATKPEVLACAADLRLLARSDFRQLLKWRERVLKSEKAVAEPAAQGEEAQPEEAEDIDSEDDMQNQILNARETLQQDARRAKKRLARQAGKERDRRAAGISDGHGMIVGHEDDEIFSFSKAAAVGGVDGIGHAEVEEEEEEAVVQRSGAVKRKKGAEEYESARERDLAVEDQLDVAYDEYASRRSLKSSAPREEKTKLSKKKRSNVASQIMQEDSMLMEGDVEQYAKQLRAGDSDSSDDSDASDDDNEAPAASRWFSRPIFDSLAAMPDSQLDADGLTKMPLTDKQQRAEKRKKASERNDRKLKKQKDKLGDEDFEMELAPKAADGKGKSTRADPKKVEP